ncbi:hypothetical protein J4E91_005262 [Alternaria rosae]|nr:hypothetical protein J4E91_005262 [Alternaria rosae]
MPSFLNASAQRCDDFISHPDAHCVRLPSGSDLYFTLPIDLDSRQPMPPQDLNALVAYLEQTPLHLAKGSSRPVYQNNLEVRSIISDWLQGSRYLDDLEMHAWKLGHGFPTFDEFGFPVDFHWVWDIIAFEGGEELVSQYVNAINAPAEPQSQAHAEDHHDSTPVRRAPRIVDTPPPSSPVEQSQHQHFGRYRVRAQADAPVSLHGATFANNDDFVAFLKTLTKFEQTLLKNDIIRFEGDSSSGLRMVRGPNAKFLPERTSQAKKESVQIHASPPDPRSRHVLVHQEDLRPVVMHHESPVKQGKVPRQEQKSGFKRVGAPSNQTVAAELDPFRFYGRESTQGAPNQVIKDQRLSDEYQNLADEYHQATKRLPVWQSREPLKEAYAFASTLERAREKLKTAAYASKNKETDAYENENENYANIYVQYTKTAQQPSSSSPFPPPNNSTRIPAPKAAASDARRKLFSAKPSAHRNLSSQEPTRLPMRPKVAGRLSSYDTGVDDPVYRYQTYAEDSWEDSPEGSPRAAPGS